MNSKKLLVYMPLLTVAIPALAFVVGFLFNAALLWRLGENFMQLSMTWSDHMASSRYFLVFIIPSLIVFGLFYGFIFLIKKICKIEKKYCCKLMLLLLLFIAICAAIKSIWYLFTSSIIILMMYIGIAIIGVLFLPQDNRGELMLKYFALVILILFTAIFSGEFYAEYMKFRKVEHIFCTKKCDHEKGILMQSFESHYVIWEEDNKRIKLLDRDNVISLYRGTSNQQCIKSEKAAE